LPILILVTVQGLLARAYANWAVTAYLGGVLLVVPILWERARRWFWIGLVINGLITVSVPIAMSNTALLKFDDRPVLRRFIGRDEVGQRVMKSAGAVGVYDIVTSNRDALAELFHQAKETDFTIYAVPPNGRPHHYYAQTFPYPAGQESPFVLVNFGQVNLPCDPISPEPIDAWQTGDDGFKFAEISMFLMPADCFAAQ